MHSERARQSSQRQLQPSKQTTEQAKLDKETRGIPKERFSGGYRVRSPKSVATQHNDRSIVTANQLHRLIKEAMTSIKVGDIRVLKTLVDAWSSWDNQMRKAHRVDEEKSEPLINIQLLASLPDEPNYIDPERVKSSELPDK